MPEGSLIVHVVHGTFAHGLFARKPARSDAAARAWFDSGGAFESAVRRHLPVMPVPLEFRPFVWSGGNSFFARAIAATELAIHLREAIRDDSDGKHLLIAHSHGGTVAVNAVAKLREQEHQQILGVLTLATPFVALLDSHRRGNRIPFEALIEMYDTVLAAAAGIAGGFALAVAGLPRAGAIVGVLSLLPLAAMLLHRFVLAAHACASVILAVLPALLWVFAPASVLVNTLLFSFATATASLLLVMKLPPPGVLRRMQHLTVEEKLVQRGPAVPLLAVRAPGDEASFAIATALALQRLERTPRRILEKVTARRWPWKFTVPAVLLTVPIYVLLSGHNPVHPMLWIVGYVFWMLSVLVLLLWGLTALMIVSTLLVRSLVALATGPELFATGGLSVFAEPLPRFEPAAECTFKLVFPNKDALESTGGMWHALHTQPQIHTLVAKWIVERAAAQPFNPANAASISVRASDDATVSGSLGGPP